jgi:hypothetical protein
MLTFESMYDRRHPNTLLARCSETVIFLDRNTESAMASVPRKHGIASEDLEYSPRTADRDNWKASSSGSLGQLLRKVIRLTK